MNFPPASVNIPPLYDIEVLSSERVQAAWEWLLENLSPRVGLDDGKCCIYDRKRWGRDSPIELKYGDTNTIEQLSVLYLSSWQGDICEIIRLSNLAIVPNIRVFTNRLEEHDRKLLAEDVNAIKPRDRYERFRYSLSEHLSFWVQLAHLSTLDRPNLHAISRPNFYPEDPGPDGMALILDAGNSALIELRSVKSSVNPPHSIIASKDFRTKSIPQDGKQIDEFYKVVSDNYGLRKREAMVDYICKVINLSVDQGSRVGLLGSATKFNAIVVANDRYARYDSFECFHFVHNDANFCIATYIGSDNWARLADRVHDRVEQILTDAGVTYV